MAYQFSMRSSVRRRSQKCVCPLVGQNATELHVDAHGQHSQKCVCPLGSRRHAYGWLHTRDIWEASQTMSDHWGFQTEQTTSKWSTVCLMYMDFGSTLQCASTLVGPYWFHVLCWETYAYTLVCNMWANTNISTSVPQLSSLPYFWQLCTPQCWHNREGGHAATATRSDAMWLRMARRTAMCWSSEPQIMCENVRNKQFPSPLMALQLAALGGLSTTSGPPRVTPLGFSKRSPRVAQAFRCHCMSKEWNLNGMGFAGRLDPS